MKKVKDENTKKNNTAYPIKLKNQLLLPLNTSA